jgi:hypothetical protein
MKRYIISLIYAHQWCTTCAFFYVRRTVKRRNDEGFYLCLLDELFYFLYRSKLLSERYLNQVTVIG